MRLVLIEWLDSVQGQSWQRTEIGEVAAVVKCRSVGWLMHDGEDCKKIIPHMVKGKGSAVEQYCGDMTIPTCAVLSIVDLEQADAKVGEFVEDEDASRSMRYRASQIIRTLPMPLHENVPEQQAWMREASRAIEALPLLEAKAEEAPDS